MSRFIELGKPEEPGVLDEGLLRAVMVANARFACNGSLGRKERDPVFEEVVEGRHKLPGYPSCAPLVHWCLRRAGLRDDRILNRPNDLFPWRQGDGIACLVHNGRAFRWAKGWTGTPHGLQPGDMALLGYGDEEHVCIVAEATDDKVVSYDYGRLFRGRHGGRRVTRRVRFDEYWRLHLSATRELGLRFRGRLDPFRLLKLRFARGELVAAEVPDDFEVRAALGWGMSHNVVTRWRAQPQPRVTPQNRVQANAPPERIQMVLQRHSPRAILVRFSGNMGRASKDDTVAGIYQAFLSQRTWRQAELARALGISTRTLRQRLAELSVLGMPVEAEDEPPHVYWSVSPSWFPGGVALTVEDAAQLLRELWLLPKSARRDRALTKLLSGLQQRDRLRTAGAAIVPAPISAAEATQRETIEDSLVSQSAVHMQYFSAHRGGLEWRHVSAVRLLAGPPLRLLARCHRTDELRWFRVDGIVQAFLDPPEPFRVTSTDAAERFIAESANGYHDESPAFEHAFLVRVPEARWVSKNLLAPMTAEPTPSGIRVVAKTAGVLPIARFVVGLGAAARAETSPLRDVVRELAEGALASAGGAPVKAARPEAPLNTLGVHSIRSGR